MRVICVESKRLKFTDLLSPTVCTRLNTISYSFVANETLQHNTKYTTAYPIDSQEQRPCVGLTGPVARHVMNTLIASPFRQS